MVFIYDIFITINRFGKGKTKKAKLSIYIYLECL